jgi:hypothetical protein
VDSWADFRSSRRRMLSEWLRGGRREGFTGCDDDDDVIMMITVDVNGWVGGSRRGNFTSKADGELVSV